MSELRLALPECKYKNDTDELLKDQFIFGIHNKEIQNHLLGEIGWKDNSVRALYKTRKIELKLQQRQMLGIVNPNAVSVHAVKSSRKICDCDYCGHTHGKGECPAFGKICNRCPQKNHFEKKCRQNLGRSSSGSKSSGSQSRHDSRRSDRAKRKCLNRCNVHEIHEECHDDGMEDLMEQSPFYQ